MRLSLLPFFGLALAAALAATSCEKTPSSDGKEDNTPFENYTSLSSDGSANCYLVSEGGNYCFDATVMGNGEKTYSLSAPKTLEPSTAALVWQTSTGMVTEVKYEEGYIGFTLSSTPGNALIAALDSKGEIIWSWHIWYPEQQPSTVKTKTGYEILDMNLGAMKSTPYTSDGSFDAAVGTYGLLYQWGRKDPFPASPTDYGDTQTVGAPLYDIDGKRVTVTNSSWTDLNSNTLSYSIAHPTVCLSNYAQYGTSRDWLSSELSNSALWGNPNGAKRDDSNDYPNKGEKSYFDPCPVGYRVPPCDVFRNFTVSGGYTESIEDCDIVDINADGRLDSMDWCRGWHFNMSGSESSYFPAAARYDGSYAMLMGSKSGLWGAYWGNAPADSDYGNGLGFCVLAFRLENSGMSTSPSAAASRADAYSVRCIKQ